MKKENIENNDTEFIISNIINNIIDCVLYNETNNEKNNEKNNETNNMNKKSIHFILPGGGVKGSFQAGFLWCLKTHYENLYTIYQIDGTSVGALNGFAFILQDIEQIRNIWFNIHSIDDIFNTYSDKPIWGKIKSIYNGFFEKSVCQNDGLKNIINTNMLNVSTDKLKLYNCVVTDIYHGTNEYINGMNEDICDYIVASASPWIIAPPVNIKNHIYIDGGLLQTYPIKDVKTSKADIKLILGKDNTHSNKLGMPGTNIFHYLIRLIEIARLNNHNISKLHKYIKKYNVVAIDNPLECPFLEFTQEHVFDGFNKGIESAHIFSERYLK
jgi:NTE family protein